MATVIQRPDSLSLLGNMKSYKISSSGPVSFRLQKSGGRATIIEEEYTPDAGGIVEISLKSVIAQFLSVTLPSSDIFSQDLASDSFSAYVDGSLVDTFTVVDCGVRKIAGSVENFLKANWLTWQPQTKLVRWNQPEYLTYYHVVASVVKAEFYLVAGGTETVTVSTAAAGDYATYNMELAHLFSLSSHDAEDLNGVVDVWVETTGGTRLSYVQRFVFTPDTRNEHYFLCTNSLGGVDTFCFTGARTLSPSLSHEVAEQSDVRNDVSADHSRSWTQNTGAFGQTEAKWIWEFFSSRSRWAVIDDNLEGIVLDSSSIGASDEDNVNSCSFGFSLSEEGTLLKIVRDSGELPAIQVPSPTGEIFFLAPRVVDYPDANLSDALLFLVQSPFVQEWKKVSLGALTDCISDSIRETAWGQLAHSHSNKAVIDLFSVDSQSGKLLFDGEPVVAEGGDYETLAHLPTINNVAVRGNKTAADFGLIGTDMFELDSTTVPGKTFIKAKYDGLYSLGVLSAGVPGTSPGGGSTVSWSQDLTSGTKIATITIDGVSTDVYAPAGGGASSLSELSDVVISSLDRWNILFFNNGSWRNIPFRQAYEYWGLLSASSNTYITGDWCFQGQKALEFYEHGACQIYGSESSGKYVLNIGCYGDIRLSTTGGGKIYANGIEITGGGGGGGGYVLPAASSNSLGGVKTGYSSAAHPEYLGLRLDSSTDRAYAQLTSAAVIAALGYTPGGGSAVSWSQDLTSGTKIATITINGVSTDVYAPAGGGGSYVLPAATSDALGGIKIGFSESGDMLAVKLSDQKAYVQLTSSAISAALGMSITDMFELDTTSVPGKTFIKAKYDGLYSLGALSAGVPGTSPGGGSAVSWSQDLTSGTKIATITINGVSTDVYAPAGGGGSYVLPAATSDALGGIKIGFSESGDMLAVKLSDQKAYVQLTSSAISAALGFTPVGAATLNNYLPLTGGTMTGDIVPASSAVSLGSSAKVWGRIYATRWYPNASDDDHYIEYTTNGFVVHGNMIAIGALTAGS